MEGNFKESIPKSLYDEIVEHLQSNCGRWAQRSWDSARAEEDAVSGGFWGRFDKQDISSQRNLDWTWNINHQILGGRGKSSAESRIGADGIFEVTVYNQDGTIKFQKAFLFQAKMQSGFSPSKTKLQASKMERFAPHGSILVVYRDGGFVAVKCDDYLTNLQERKYAFFDVCDYIIQEFFSCRHGKRNMSYSIDEKVLTTSDGEEVPAVLDNVVELEVRQRRKK